MLADKKPRAVESRPHPGAPSMPKKPVVIIPQREVMGDWAARLDKNFDGRKLLRNRVVKDGVTATDLFLLFAFLAEAQRRKDPRLRFESRYVALKFLRLPGGDGQHEYDALHHALDKWSALGFHPKSWHIGKSRYEARHIDNVWTIRWRESAFTLSFSDAFWDANMGRSRFVYVKPQVVRRLKHAQEILLLLRLSAFSWHVHMGVDAWACVLGLKDTKKKRLIASLERAAAAVGNAMGVPLFCTPMPGNKLLISRLPPSAEPAPASAFEEKMDALDARIAARERARLHQPKPDSEGDA